MKRTLALFAFALMITGTAVSAAAQDKGMAQAVDKGHMQAAIDMLNLAKEELKKADADKGGHRAKALKHVDEAIEQTRKGINYDREHKK